MIVGPERFPKAIFFDLDGTLLAPGAVLRRTTAEAVWAAAGRGATIVLATGGFAARTHLLVDVLAARAPGQVWAISHNGAATWNPHGMLAHCDSTPVGAVETVLAYAGARLWATYEIVDTLGRTHVFYAGRTRADLSHLIWGPNGERVDGPDVEHQPSGLVVGLEPRWNRRRARSAAALSDATILGCWCVGTPEALAPLDAQARNGDFFGARYLPWGARLSQILKRPRLRLVGRDVGAKTATKGVAAARLCAQLGIAPEETAAFGDGDNDLELLEFAGTAVAMANGTPRSRARAGLIAPPHSADGVAQVLRRWLGDLRA